MVRLKKLIGSCLLLGLSSCGHTPPSIIQVGECEHGIVHKLNVNDVRKVWPEAQITDVLISGACYQNHFIKKGK